MNFRLPYWLRLMNMIGKQSFLALAAVLSLTQTFGQRGGMQLPQREGLLWSVYATRTTPWRSYERLQGRLHGVLVEGAEAVRVLHPNGDLDRVIAPELPDATPGAHPLPFDSNSVWLVRDSQWIAARSEEVYEAHPLRRMRYWRTPSGQMIDSLDLIRRLDTLVATKVFAPDPVTRDNVAYGGLYVDGNDGNQAVLDSLRQQVLLRLSWNGSGFVLANAAATIQEFDPPSVTVPVLSAGNTVFSRSAPEFEMVNTLFHLHAWKERMTALGYGSMVPYSIPVDVNAYGGADQSAFDYATNPPRLYFGEGGVDDAEDPDVLVHEYGHAMCYGAAPGTNVSTQRQALEEAICDYFAVSWSREWSPNRWTDVFTWDGHNSFWSGRNAVNSQQKMYPGLVFTGPYSHTAVMVDALVRGRQRLGGAVMDGLVMEALYSLTANTTFADFAQAVLHADTVKYAGAHAAGLRLDFGTWQILTPGLGDDASANSAHSGALIWASESWPFGDDAEVLLWDALGRHRVVRPSGPRPEPGWYVSGAGTRVLVIP